MAEGTKVGTGYVLIDGDFTPLHRRLEAMRTTWARKTGGLNLALGFDRAGERSIGRVTDRLQATRAEVRGLAREFSDATRAARDWRRDLQNTVAKATSGLGSKLIVVRREFDTFGRALAVNERDVSKFGLAIDGIGRRGLGTALGRDLDALTGRVRGQLGDVLGEVSTLRRTLTDPSAFRIPGLETAAGDLRRFRVETHSAAVDLEDTARRLRTLRALGSTNLLADLDTGRIGRVRQSLRSATESLRSWGRQTVRARADSLELERATIALQYATERHGAASLQARDAQLRLEQVQARQAQRSGLMARSFARIGGQTSLLNQRFQLLRNTIFALRWPAIITGAGLAAQALSSLSAALVAVVSAAGPAIGVLGALPGALASAAQGISVFRLATMGVADAMKEQIKNATGLTGAESAQADSARRLTDAKVAVRDAEEALTQARKDAARAIRDQKHEVVTATIDEERATWALREARAALKAIEAAPDDLELADARDRVADSTRDIAAAEAEYQAVVRRTALILDDPNASLPAQLAARRELADAEDSVRDARRGLAHANRDLRTTEAGPSELVRARQDVRAAEEDLTEATRTRVLAVRELGDLEERGIARSAQVVQAERQLASAQRDLLDAQAGGVVAAGRLNQQFDQLPKSAQGFVSTLLALRPRFDELRAVAADGLFPGARAGLLAAMRNFRPLRAVVDATARTLGGLARVAGRLVGSAGFGRDLQLVGGRNAVVIRRVGRAAIILGDALRHVMVAAGPLLGWLSRVTVRWAQYLRGQAKAGRESGTLARFFERTRAVLERLGSITGNVAVAFKNIGRAATPLGNAILGALDRASEGWARWTGSVGGQNTLLRYFNDSRPAIFEFGRLLRDVTKSFFRLGSLPGTDRLVRLVRVELLPAFERFLAVTSRTFGPALIRALTNVVKLFSELAGAGGILSSVVRLLGGIAGGFAWLIRNVPGVKQLTFAVIALGGAVAAIRVAAVVTGFASLARMVTRTALAYRALATGQAAASVAGSVGVAATGAAQVAASSRLAGLFSLRGIVRAAGGRAAIVLAGSRLGGLLGTSITAGIGTAIGGGAAGGAAAGVGAAGGLLAGLRRGIGRVVRAGGLAGVGIAIGSGIMSEAQNAMDERSRDLVKRLRGLADMSGGELIGDFIHTGTSGLIGKDSFSEMENARGLLAVYQRMQTSKVRLSEIDLGNLRRQARELDLTKAQRAEVNRMIALLQRGSRLRIGVSLNMEQASKQIEGNFRALRSGALTNLRDVLRVSRRNMRLIAETLGVGSTDGRRALAQNMRLTARAVESAMRRAGVRTEEGMARIARLIRNADLISPTRKAARDFGREWARGMDTSKEITRRGLQRMLAEARKMPGPMRAVALDIWLGQLEAARKNNRLTQREFEELQSTVVAVFPRMRTVSRETAKAVPRNVADMTNATTDAFGVLGRNTNSALEAFGVRPVKFKFEKARTQKKQQGGMIVPGTGSGDTFSTTLPAGSFVMNRNATAAFGFNHGGVVPVALEPRERVFFPDDVKRIGLGRLHAMNDAVPRFQAGGIVALGRQLQREGYEVGEHSLFGGVHPVHVANSYHYRDMALDINDDVPPFASGGGEPGSLDRLYARLKRMKGVVELLWRVAHHFDHLHVAMAGDGMLPGTFDLPRLKMVGPDGPLRSLGQAAVDKVRRAGLKFGRSQAGAESAEPGFTGSAGGSYGKRALMDLWTQVGGSPTAANLAAAVALAESGGNPNNVNYNTNGTVDRGLWQINSIHGALSTFDPVANARGAVSISSNGTNWTPWVVYNTGAYRQFLQLGGMIQALQDGGVAGGDGSGLSRLIGSLGRIRRKPLSKRLTRGFKERIRKALRAISGIGLPVGEQQAMVTLSDNADIWEEFAQRAGTLSYEMVDPRTGEPILDAERRPMTFFAQVNGKTEEGWTNERLGALFTLRDKLVQAVDIVRREQERVQSLIEQTQKRIKRLVAAITRTKTRRSDLRREIDDTAAKIDRTRRSLAKARERGDTRAVARLGRELDAQEDHLRTLRRRHGGEDRDLADRQRRQEETRNRLLTVLGDDDSGLLGKRATLADLLPSLLGTGGSFDGFKNLKDVQGMGGKLERLSALPPIGALGGEIFDAQQILAELGRKPEPVSPGGDIGSDSERADLEHELRIQAQQEAFVANQQFAALRDFPPFGGSFATGGVVPGPTGAARMILAHGGETVVPVDAPASDVRVVIQDQRTRVFINDQEVRAIVRDETRQMARGGLAGARAGGLRR